MFIFQASSKSWDWCAELSLSESFTQTESEIRQDLDAFSNIVLVSHQTKLSLMETGNYWKHFI